MSLAVGGPSHELQHLVTRDAVSGAGKAGAWLGKNVAKTFGGGKRKQAEYAAGASRAAEQLATKYMPKVKSKLRELGAKAVKKGLSYVKFKKGGRVKRRKGCACGGMCKMRSGGKVRSQFHFKH